MEEKCKSCGSIKLCSITAKCSDGFFYTNLWSGYNYKGYVPIKLGIGGGDYVNFTFCRDCGQIQGDWKIRTCELLKVR